MQKIRVRDTQVVLILSKAEAKWLQKRLARNSGFVKTRAEERIIYKLEAEIEFVG